jgi:hypothetical protein
MVTKPNTNEGSHRSSISKKSTHKNIIQTHNQQQRDIMTMMPLSSTGDYVRFPRWIPPEGPTTRPVVKSSNIKRPRDLKRSKSLPTTLAKAHKKIKVPPSRSSSPKPQEEQPGARRFQNETRFPNEHPFTAFPNKVICNRYLLPIRCKNSKDRYALVEEDRLEEEESSPLRGLEYIDD